MAALLTLTGAAALLKLMFIPAYRSTDFEVHRNWLAITHSLPLSKWYTEATSEWTLDYPPLFAWFEWCLSQVASYVDSGMLQVSNLNYASDATIIFQRISVILTDFVFFYAIKEFQKLGMFNTTNLSQASYNGNLIPILLIFNFGLCIVDHIHFQYNGILFGIMLLSIVRILQKRTLEGAFWFSVLLNMKHIYLYIAPAYFIYLLRTYCFKKNKNISVSSFSSKNFLNLSSVVIIVFGISFGPFIYHGQLGQVLSRLFPFKRGLVHAYWAPNFWALYNAIDKVLTFIAVRVGVMSSGAVPAASMTGGMVQEYNHVVLPSVAPIVTLLLTAVGMLPALLALWKLKSPAAFVRAIILCAFTSFLFGWHVHEKAIIMVIIPLTLLIKLSAEDARIFLVLSTTGNFSLFPLLFTPFEMVIEYLLYGQSVIFSFVSISEYYRAKTVKSCWTPVRYFSDKMNRLMFQITLPLLSLSESLYVWGLQAVTSLVSGMPLKLIRSNLFVRLPFLPLLLTSVYCAVGIVYCWYKFYRNFLIEAFGDFRSDDCDRRKNR